MLAMWSLTASLAIIVWYNIEQGVSLAWPWLAAHRLEVFFAAVALIWAPASFAYLRRVLDLKLGIDWLPPDFNTATGSLALCAVSALSATVAILTYGTRFEGGTGRNKSGTWFIWALTHFLLTWLALRRLNALPPAQERE